MKINELRTCSPKISSIRPRMNQDRIDDENCLGEKLHSTEALISDCKYDLPKLQIRSPPFRMKINKSPTSPPNFRSIEPQMNRYRPFDQIWAVKIKEKKTVFFFSSLTSKRISLFLSSFSLMETTKIKKKRKTILIVAAKKILKRIKKT